MGGMMTMLVSEETTEAQVIILTVHTADQVAVIGLCIELA